MREVLATVGAFPDHPPRPQRPEPLAAYRQLADQGDELREQPA
ncbi:hypothetical protein EDD27_0141 [Nonomuraea polychroma]|uniref:Uncharacterized protein n=1 Tax=Nonomuraea polychroma TaxID=46176 RepID=A0A438LWK5_9ACTN|nr:hypothetical protein [Nonomuraea polychroma]RVX37862.1 hypothetical protein EDD27_0141 [Nonomuraea polychroma]